MTKIVDLYTTIKDRLTAALADGQTLSYFASVKGGYRKEGYENKDLPAIVVTVGSGNLETDDMSQLTASQSITVQIMAQKANGTDYYYNSTDSTGIIVDLENVLNTILSDYDLNGNANERPEIDYQIDDSEGNGYLTCTITINAKSLPFVPGGI